jgi:hypothetical protein
MRDVEARIDDSDDDAFTGEARRIAIPLDVGKVLRFVEEQMFRRARNQREVGIRHRKSFHLMRCEPYGADAGRHGEKTERFSALIFPELDHDGDTPGHVRERVRTHRRRQPSHESRCRDVGLRDFP